jgi:hypothetical protein
MTPAPRNPYAAPAAGDDDAFPADSERHWTTANGSRADLGERTLFTEAWISASWSRRGRRLATRIALTALAAMAAAAAVGAGATAMLIAILVAAVAALCSAGPLLAGATDGNRLIREFADLRPVGMLKFPVSIAFCPRLPGTAIEHQEAADDLGSLLLLPDSLRFRGDRLDLDLAHADVASIQRLWRRPGGPPLTVGYSIIKLELRDSLCERRALWLRICEAGGPLHGLRRDSDLCTMLKAWYRAGRQRI